MRAMTGILGALLMLPALAQAAVPKPTPVPGVEQSRQFQPSGAYAQVYYYPAADSDLTSPGGVKSSIEGDGFGVSGYFPLVFTRLPLFAVADYSTIDYDAGAELDEWRLGIGYQLTGNFGAYVHLADLDEGAGGSDGYAVHAVYNTALGNTPFSVYADAGYFLLESDSGLDVDGYEYWLGALYAFTPRFSGLFDFRGRVLEDDAGVETDALDFRVGVRMHF